MSIIFIFVESLATQFVEKLSCIKSRKRRGGRNCLKKEKLRWENKARMILFGRNKKTTKHPEESRRRRRQW